MRRVLETLLLSFILLFSATAQEKPGNWYVGIKGGTSFGVSTFSSLNSDKLRVGWNTGLLAGYRFSDVWSMELSAVIGSLEMGSRDCCAAYYMGSDGQLYFAPVAGLDTYSYPSLYSEVKIQQYSVQLNFDLLQLFVPNSERRWSVCISPVLSALVSRAEVNTKEGRCIFRHSSRCNFGVGGDLSAGYRLSSQWEALLYSEALYLPGPRIDGMPRRLHRNNCIWTSGLKLIWSVP